MSFYPNNDPVSEFKRFFTQRSELPLLILANVIIWIIIRVSGSILFLFKINISGDILEALALPANPSELISRPWTLLTHMFTHFDFFHLLFNMLWLYWFGRIFLEFIDRKKLLISYFGGGLVGGIFFVASYNMFPAFSDTMLRSTAIGASAAVMSVVTTISFYQPHYSIGLMFIGMVKIRIIAIISIFFDLIMINTSNSGGHLAHVGGAAFGILLAYLFKQDIRLGGINPFRGMKRTGKKTNFAGRRARPITDEDYNAEKAERQKRMDYILDKISRSGYDSLTREEKEFLFKSSNRNNK